MEVAASEEKDICQDLVRDVVDRRLIVDTGRFPVTSQNHTREVITGDGIHSFLFHPLLFHRKICSKPQVVVV